MIQISGLHDFAELSCLHRLMKRVVRITLNLEQSLRISRGPWWESQSRENSINLSFSCFSGFSSVIHWTSVPPDLDLLAISIISYRWMFSTLLLWAQPSYRRRHYTFLSWCLPQQPQQVNFSWSSLKLTIITDSLAVPLVVVGAASERGRIWPMIVFVFVWCTLVYNFVAYWIWAPNGWAAILGTLDFAGGVPVHMIAGVSSLVYNYMLGHRQPVTHAEQNRPHNVNNIFLGTVLSWFGWFGFNGGSGLVISTRAALACAVTNLAACTGGFTWCMWDYFLSKPRHKFTMFGFCMGAMAGLVCITPGSGYVGLASSLVFGIGGSTCVYFGRRVKVLLKVDDAFDIFAQHGIGGFVGSLLTGIFAQQDIAALDQATIPGGWLNGHWIQILYQMAFAGKWSPSDKQIVIGRKIF